MFHRAFVAQQAEHRQLRRWRHRAGSLLIVGALLLPLPRHALADAAQESATTTMPPPPLTSQPAAADPCLPNDPYQLAALNQAISATNPPTGTVTINRFINITFIAKGTLVEQTEDLATVDPHFLPPTIPGQPNPNERDAATVPTVDGRIRVFNTRTTNEFEIALDAAMLDAIHKCRTEAGLHAGTLGVDDPVRVENGFQLFLPMVTTANQAESLTSAALSDGQDSRIIRAPTTTWPWRAIAQLGSGCTGTLVGPRHVITVAHCINRFGTNTWFGFTVRPGRDGGTVPYGSSTISTTVPTGQEAWYFTHPQWRNPNIDNPWQWDWGFIVIPDRLGDATGWMGYYAFTASSMRQNTHLNRGYPACWSTRPEPNSPLFSNTPTMTSILTICRILRSISLSFL